AVAEPPQGHQGAAQRTVHADRLLGVARAAGLEAAGRRPAGHERVHDEAPQVDGAEQQPERDPPHAALPLARSASSRTSVSSQSSRSPASASARPGRATITRSTSEDSPGVTRAAASRRRRLTRLRSTAPPTLRETVRPTRGSAAPEEGSRANA